MKTIFWNVDTQIDFMDPRGLLYVKNAETIKPNLARLTRFARKNKMTIITTGDWHQQKTKEFSQFPPHCLMNSIGAKHIKETLPVNPYVISWQDKDFDENILKKSTEILLYKDEYDIFSDNPHNEVLEILNPYRVVVYGVATDVCVKFAVEGLVKRKYRVVVVEDAVKELPGSDLQKLFKGWVSKGVRLSKTIDIVK